MIGLSLDKEVETAKKYVAENGLKWLQGFLGDWSKAAVAEEYGITGIPAELLIDADGKLIAKNLRGEQLKSAVAEALGKAADSKGDVHIEIEKR